MFSRFDRIPACNRQTDGQTDRQASCYGIVCAMHTRRAVKRFLFPITSFSLFGSRTAMTEEKGFRHRSDSGCGCRRTAQQLKILINNLIVAIIIRRKCPILKTFQKATLTRSNVQNNNHLLLPKHWSTLITGADQICVMILVHRTFDRVFTDIFISP